MSRQSGPFEVPKKIHAETFDSCASQGNGPLSYSVSLSSASNFDSSRYRPHLLRQRIHSQGKLVQLYSNSRCRSSNNSCPETLEEDLDTLAAPERNYECDHYNTCLSLAAALNWDSFSCEGCGGCVNKKLLWRAHHALRKNNSLKVICDLPILS